LHSYIYNTKTWAVGELTLESEAIKQPKYSQCILFFMKKEKNHPRWWMYITWGKWL